MYHYLWSANVEEGGEREGALELLYPPSILNPQTGYLGFILRSVFVSMSKDLEKSTTFQLHSIRFQKRFNQMLADDFWISSKIDGLLGNARGEAVMGDAIRSLCNNP